MALLVSCVCVVGKPNLAVLFFGFYFLFGSYIGRHIIMLIAAKAPSSKKGGANKHAVKQPQKCNTMFQLVAACRKGPRRRTGELIGIFHGHLGVKRSIF